MKKNRLFFMFAALFVSAAVLFSCQKEEVPNVDVQLKSELVALDDHPDCDVDCIEAGIEIFYPVFGMATGSAGPNTKSVSYSAYNTETDFVVEVTYAITTGKSKAEATITINIDGDEMEHIGVSPGSMVSHTVPLAGGWAGCDQVAFSILQEGLGAPISFNESYSLIPVCTEESLKIGDTYQGGKIAYILQPGDPGYDANVTHGIIAAPSDQSTGIQWYNGSHTTTGATGTALGTGQANTTAIVGQQKEGIYAAQLCNDLVIGEYDDWYLPSQDELDKLYLNRMAIGGFGDNIPYWSSSEYTFDEALYQFFLTGNQTEYVKDTPFRVRAIRAF